MAKTMKWINLGAFFAMVTVNILANVLPIGGMNTGEISAQYQNLFTPAGITFAIWSVIYVLLGIGLIIQLVSTRPETNAIVRNMGPWFAISCGLNILWIFMWHFGLISFATAAIFLLTANMYILVNRVRDSGVFYWGIGIYTGWITVASVASMFVFANWLGWSGEGTLSVILTIAAILICATITGFGTLMSKDLGYGLAVLWAILGIMIKHITTFGGKYMIIIGVTLIGMGILSGFIIKTIQILYIEPGRKKLKTSNA